MMSEEERVVICDYINLILNILLEFDADFPHIHMWGKCMNRMTFLEDYYNK